MLQLYNQIVKVLPVDIPREANLCFTINKNVTCYPHRDTANEGDTLIIFFWDYEGGALVTETGQRFEETRLWHRFKGDEVTHWNEPHFGDKYSVVAHRNKRPLPW